ncbi:MAG: site-specific integrase, partial [Actinomycetota bacterium]
AVKLARMLLNRALDDELIAVNRASRVQAPAIQRQRPQVLTPEQLSALVDATEDRYRALVALNAWSGCRWSEVACLELDAVDFLRRQMRVERAVVEVKGRHIIQDAKTTKSRRTIPLPAFVVEQLAEHVRLFPPVDTDLGTLLFTTETGKPIHRNHFQRRVWQPALERAGLTGSKIRHLRHTGASLVLAAGGNPKDVAERLGHTTTRMADELYVELYESRGRDLVARMETLAAETRPKRAPSRAGATGDEA